MKVAVIQHRLRSHERMDLAALLSSAEEAAYDGASVIVCPRLPGLAADTRIYHAFIENMRNRAPGSLVLTPVVTESSDGDPEPFMTPLGRTVSLSGDRCIDPDGLQRVAALEPDAMLWQPEAESPVQAEAILELALDASLTVAGLVVVTALAGRARGVSGAGGAAIVELGEILAEAGGGEEVVSAEFDAPVPRPDRPGRRPAVPPILAQRLAHHAGRRAEVEWPADTS